MSSSEKPHIAFLGLGAMGLCMATHLYRSHYPITGYDIYPPTLEKFLTQCKTIQTESSISQPANTATSPAEAVKHAQIILLMVATHHHVESALFTPETGAIHSLPKDSVVVINSTVPPTYPATVRHKLDTEYSRPDIRLIDAPVSGGTARAVNGTLTIMASADQPATLKLPLVQSTLDVLSDNAKNLYPIPGPLGSGTSAKALNQVNCGIHIVASSEIIGLASILSVNPQRFYDTITAGTTPQNTGVTGKRQGWSWMFSNRVPRMLDPSAPIASATSIIHKDVGIILDETKRLDIHLPLVQAAYTQLQRTMDAGLASADDSSIVTIYLGKEREHLVTETAQKPSREDEGEMIEHLCAAHAAIHALSAYETMKFAEALKMTSPEQRAQWFDIIAGAAGASTAFTEVIPRLLDGGEGSERGFRAFVREKMGQKGVQGLDSLLKMAEERKYEAGLVRLTRDCLKRYVD